MINFDWIPFEFSSENQVSDSDEMDTQTTSSHAESGDAVACIDEANPVETSDGKDNVQFLV